MYNAQNQEVGISFQQVASGDWQSLVPVHYEFHYFLISRSSLRGNLMLGIQGGEQHASVSVVRCDFAVQFQPFRFYPFQVKHETIKIGYQELLVSNAQIE